MFPHRQTQANTGQPKAIRTRRWARRPDGPLGHAIRRAVVVALAAYHNKGSVTPWPNSTP